MRVRLIGLLLFPLMSINLYSQAEKNDKPSVSQRTFFGGSFSLQLGTVTNIDMAPVVGFWLLPRLNIAAGPSFQFYSDRYDRTIIYGGRSYTQFYLVQDLDNIIPAGTHLGLFIQGEYKILSLKRSFFDYTSGNDGRFVEHYFQAGAGVAQPIGPGAAVEFSVLWVLNDPEYDFYGTPEVRISMIF